MNIEGTILNSIIVNNELLDTAIEVLNSGSFSSGVYNTVWGEMCSLSSLNKPIDIDILLARLGDTHIAEISKILDCNTVSDITEHCKMVKEAENKRKLRLLLEQSLQNINNESVSELANKIDVRLLEISTSKKTGFETTKTLVSDLVEEMCNNESSGVKTGFLDLDKHIEYVGYTDLVIIAGRPAMGKTTFTQNIYRNFAYQYNQIPLVFSLEMSKMQLLKRLVVELSMIPRDVIKSKNYSAKQRDQLNAAFSKLYDSTEIIIEDDASVTVEMIRAKSRAAKRKFNIGAIFIDYLQLITNSGVSKGNQVVETAHKTRMLKLLAKELNVPVFCISQLSRGPESQPGTNKRPNMSHLRDSGAIEQDADMIWFPYRPSVYKDSMMKDYSDENRAPASEFEAELIIAKAREAEPGIIPLSYFGQYSRFDNYVDENKMAF